MEQKQPSRRASKPKVRPSIISQLAIPHYSLTNTEKRFLLCAERGDCASVTKLLDENKDNKAELDINCLDPLNRSALIIALEKENIDLIELLLERGIDVKDALLHAINEEYVEGVEVLLQWEEKTHVKGEPYSWEAVDKSASGYTTDITPVILAAHKNNYEILKLLLDRGATLPSNHDIRCGCDTCITSKEQDSLRFSQSRINAYRAMISPSLICLSSRDPLLTSMELYFELKRLSKMETEFRAEYNEMRQTVQTFSTGLLDHVRTSNELDIILNYDPDPNKTPWEPGDRQTLERLKLAIKYKLKALVAHPNVQQLLASIWYKGLPGFRRLTMFQQIIEVFRMGSMFWVYSMVYIVAPDSEPALFLKNPFVKFVCHSASYASFLGLLALASQRVETLALEILGHMGHPFLLDIVKEWQEKERGSMFGMVESMIVLFVLSLIWKEMRSLYEDGLLEYITDLWNILDFCSNLGYVTWISLRLTAAYVVHREYLQGLDPWYPRNKWDKFDPHMLSECAFASSMILSFMKLVNIFSVNPHLGPLQISLGRMIIDIIKFFFIYTLVLFAFGCGMNQLLWYFAGLESDKCYHIDGLTPDFEHEDKACTIWRRFANLFETSQSLFWASFGLVDLTAFDLNGIKSFTRFWALLIFGCYSVINIIVLLNMLIAMMSNSYQIISERSDTEWKFARSRLFISFFEEGDTLPAPFNLFPSSKHILKLFGIRKKRMTGSMMRKKESERERADLRYDLIMQLLVRRYITTEQKKLEEFAVTEDDIAEVRHDISTLRFELIDIFKRNNFNVPKINTEDMAQGKKDRLMERRIVKDFQIGMVEGVVNDIITSEQKVTNIFGKIAKAIGKGDSKKKKDWNEIARKSTLRQNPIGSTDEAQRKTRQQSIRRYIIDHQGEDVMKMDPDKLVEYNPQLSHINPTARIAYARFKMALIKQEFNGVQEGRLSISMERRESKVSATKRGSLLRAATVPDAIHEDTQSESETPSTPTPKAPKLEKMSTVIKSSIDRRLSQADKPPLPPKPDDITSPERKTSLAGGTAGSRRSSLASMAREPDSSQGSSSRKASISSTSGKPGSSRKASTSAEMPTSSDEAAKPDSEQKKEHVVLDIESKSTLKPESSPAPGRSPAVTPKKVVGGKWL
ncbi:transient receptor potential protein-like [Planococcus citri]|uniref:transient receptor potential protein-like n=1 Tax=Planococcus citri TaxID=170843 RepID=UPI0031F94218